jgi:hypothetical protein
MLRTQDTHTNPADTADAVPRQFVRLMPARSSRTIGLDAALVELQMR